MKSCLTFYIIYISTCLASLQWNKLNLQKVGNDILNDKVIVLKQIKVDEACENMVFQDETAEKSKPPKIYLIPKTEQTNFLFYQYDTAQSKKVADGHANPYYAKYQLKGIGNDGKLQWEHQSIPTFMTTNSIPPMDIDCIAPSLEHPPAADANPPLYLSDPPNAQTRINGLDKKIYDLNQYIKSGQSQFALCNAPTMMYFNLGGHVCGKSYYPVAYCEKCEFDQTQNGFVPNEWWSPWLGNDIKLQYVKDNMFKDVTNDNVMVVFYKEDDNTFSIRYEQKQPIKFYYEPQVEAQCVLHSANTLVQKKKWNEKQFVQWALELDKRCPRECVSSQHKQSHQHENNICVLAEKNKCYGMWTPCLIEKAYSTIDPSWHTHRYKFEAAPMNVEFLIDWFMKHTHLSGISVGYMTESVHEGINAGHRVTIKWNSQLKAWVSFDSGKEIAIGVHLKTSALFEELESLRKGKLKDSKKLQRADIMFVYFDKHMGDTVTTTCSCNDWKASKATQDYADYYKNYYMNNVNDDDERIFHAMQHENDYREYVILEILMAACSLSVMVLCLCICGVFMLLWFVFFVTKHNV